nr:MAG TPA: hypothetical protein [Caudoviricetes sp.]
MRTHHVHPFACKRILPIVAVILCFHLTLPCD